MNVAIITAGGSGKRLNKNIKKQFIKIAGRPILCWTLDHFVNHPQIDKIIITLPQFEIENFTKILEQEYPHTEFNIIAGGKKRQVSVLNALQACPPETEYVLIHDGVRPFIRPQLISSLLAKASQAEGVIPVSKVKNTIKEIDADQIKGTLPRENLVNALTPQVFRFPLILQLHKKAKEDKLQVTDDASVCENFGYRVKYWLTDGANFKITDSHDLKIAKFIIKNIQE